jgi:hypothetical protein
VKQTREDKYNVKITNFESMKLPVEILADGKITTVMLDKTAITIDSKTPIQIYPKGFYLKRVILE